MKRTTSRRYNLLLLLVTFASLGAFWLAIFDVLGRQSPSGPAVWTVGIPVAVAGAIIFAIFVCSDLWLLLGQEGLFNRLKLVMITNIGPCLFLGLGYGYVALRGIALPILQLRLTTIVVQRLAVWVVLLVLGSGVRWFVHARLIRTTSGRTQSRSSQTSIKDIMLMTALAAVIIVCTRPWFGLRTIPSPMRQVIAELILLAFAEVLLVIAVVMPALLLSAWANESLRRVPKWVATWVLLCGAVLATFTFTAFGLDFSWEDGFIGGGIFLAATAAFALSLFIVLWIVVRAGFHLWLPGDAFATGGHTKPTTDTNTTKRKRSWATRIACLALVVATIAVPYLVDLPVLMRTGSLQRATDFAWLLREEGVFAPRSEQVGSQLVTPQSGHYDLKGESNKLARIMRRLVPSSVSTLAMKVSDKPTDELLNEIAGRKIVRAYLYFPKLDHSEFARFCQSAKIAEIHGLVLDPRNYEAIKQIRGLKNVTFPHQIPWTDEWQQAVDGLPLRKLTIMLEEDGLGDTSGLAKLPDLTIHRSKITAEIVRELNALGLENLTLSDCELDPTGARAFRDSKLKVLAVQDSKETLAQISDETLTTLARSTQGVHVEIRTDRDPLFMAKLQNQFAHPRSTVAPQGYALGYGQHDFEPDDYETLVNIGERIAAGQSQQDVFEQVANILRDEQGRIVEINVQDVPVSWLDFSTLDLDALVKLRVGSYMEKKSLFRQIGRLSSLQELDVTEGNFGLSEFSEVCKLKKLRRLQLPLGNGYSLAQHVEHIPLHLTPDHATEILDALSLNQSLFGDNLETPTTDELLGIEAEEDSWPQQLEAYEFQKIRQLQELEYLFIPGHLISRRTIPEFKSLPKLRELHAVFSLVDAELMRQVAELPQLEKLSIGVRVPNKGIIQELGKLKKLRQLQLTIFDSNINSNPTRQKQIRKALQKALPDCEVHLLLLDDFPSN